MQRQHPALTAIGNGQHYLQQIARFQRLNPAQRYNQYRAAADSLYNSANYWQRQDNRGLFVLTHVAETPNWDMIAA
jgi:capsule polysaccharide export protein KpsE/RkpR